MKTSAVRPEATRGRLVLRLRAGIAVLAGRLTYRMLRVAGRSATTLPGRIALALDPDLLRRLASRYRVVLVTGTNGKTTASRMITGILRRAGRHVADNPAGANLSSGLTTALLKTGTSTRHADSFPIAVLEVDEAAFAAASASLAPEICIVTNIFRDQLDRYGERDAMRGLIAKGLADAFAARGDRGATFVFCADDPLCESLADPYRNHSEVQVVFTGMDEKEMHPAGIRDGIPGETAQIGRAHV